MWRSVTRKASLYKGINHFSHIQQHHQVSFSKTLISAETLFPAFFCPKSHFHQTPLFLSQDSSDPFVSNAEISESEGKNSESFDFGDDAHNMFDKMPSLDSAVTEVDDAEICRAGSNFFEGFSDSTNVLDNIPNIDCEEDGLARSSSPSICGDDLNVEGFDCGGDEKNDGSEVQGVISEELKNVLSLLQSTCVSVASSLPPKLDNLNPSLSEEFLLRVTETPVLPGGILIAFFRWVLSVEKKSLVTTRVLESLVRVIGKEVKRNSAYALWDFLKEFGEEGLLTTCILNDLLSLLSELAKGKAGFEVFNKFEEFGCVPDESSFYFTIEALCRRSLFPWAVSVCENMIRAGKLPDSQRIGKIVSYLCKGKRARDAHSVYLSAKKMDRFPPRTTVNFLICSLSREDANVHLALEMLEEIPKKERKYAIKMFSSVICGLCRISEIEKAKILLFDMIEAGPPPGNAVFNTIINSLSKAGEMGEAQKIMELMESRGLRPDVYTYSVIMSGYAKGGEMDEACKVLAEAKKQHKKLNPITYHTIIRGYCRLEKFDKALELLNEMKQSGLQPTADEYNKLIQSLCLKALDWETAKKLMVEMEDNGFQLNGITRGLIRAVSELEKEEASTKEIGVEV